jgi:pyruvate dehydrogenase E1 component alpha subunit
VEDAREGQGPQLIEFKTLRMRGHAVHDDASYYPPGLVDEWKKKDPIARFEKKLKLTQEEKAAVEDRLKATVDDAVEFAEKSPPPPGENAYKGVFEDDSIVQFTPWWRRDA